MKPHCGERELALAPVAVPNRCPENTPSLSGRDPNS
jgi:hypothetical protein